MPSGQPPARLTSCTCRTVMQCLSSLMNSVAASITPHTVTAAKGASGRVSFCMSGA